MLHKNICIYEMVQDIDCKIVVYMIGNLETMSVHEFGHFL